MKLLVQAEYHQASMFAQTQQEDLNQCFVSILMTIIAVNMTL